jgi:hypothetical protein
MEIHRAPGPPRTNIVISGGTRLAVLEVGPDRARGAVHHADRRRWTFQRPPAATEWWISDDAGASLGTVARTTLVRERFALEIAGTAAEVVPVSKPWRRRWSVIDGAGREIIEVVQRPYSRTVHDLWLRSGDVPPDLPLVVAWVVALATSDRMPETRRARWTASGRRIR